MVFQWSGVVLLTLFLVKSSTSSNSPDGVGTLTEEQLQQLANIFRQLNSYFDNSMVRNDPKEVIREVNQTDLSSLTSPNSHETSPNEENIQNIPIQTRSTNTHTPWYCPSIVAWKDLGSLHYPRFIKEIRCAGNACMHGFYNCRPSHYPVRVLSSREGSARINQNVEDSFLPPGLRQNWTMMDIDISVGCICGN